MSLNLSLIMRLIPRPGSRRGEQGQGGALADAREIFVADEARFQLAGIPSDRDCADVKRMLGVLGIVCSAGSVYDPAYEAAEPPVERRVVHAGRYGVCYPIGQDPASPLSSPRSGTRGKAQLSQFPKRPPRSCGEVRLGSACSPARRHHARSAKLRCRCRTCRSCAEGDETGMHASSTVAGRAE